jgi:glutathione S-transferase
MKLYTAWYCPFAQRAWMTLVHKNINFDYIEVDPYDKTES